MAPAAKKRKAAEAKGKAAAAAAAMPEAKGKAAAAAPSKAKGKAKAQEPPPRAWAAEALADIDAATDPEALKSLVEELSRLNAIAEERLDIAKRAAERTGLVVLVESKQSQDKHEGIGIKYKRHGMGFSIAREYGIEYKRNVEANFTLGPKEAPFELQVRCEAEPIEEGEEGEEDLKVLKVRVSHQYAELRASNSLVLVLDDQGDALSKEWNAEELAKFLTAAGLERALPHRALNKDGTAMSTEERNALPDAERHEWILLDVLYDAASLLEEKHGVVDENGVNLGLDLYLCRVYTEQLLA